MPVARQLAFAAHPVEVVEQAAGAAHAVEHLHPLLELRALGCTGVRGRDGAGRWRAWPAWRLAGQRLCVFPLRLCLRDLLFPAHLRGHGFGTFDKGLLLLAGMR